MKIREIDMSFAMAEKLNTGMKYMYKDQVSSVLTLGALMFHEHLNIKAGDDLKLLLDATKKSLDAIMTRGLDVSDFDELPPLNVVNREWVSSLSSDMFKVAEWNGKVSIIWVEAPSGMLFFNYA